MGEAAENLEDYSQHNDYQMALELARHNDMLHAKQNAQSEGVSDNYARNPEGTHHGNYANGDSKTAQANNLMHAAKDLSGIANPVQNLTLLKYVNFIGDIPFAFAAMAAIVKDILILVTFELVIIPIILSALCSIFIFMMLFLVDAGGKKKIANSLIKKGAVLIAGGLIGSFFPVVETATVALIYYMTLAERRNAEKD